MSDRLIALVILSAMLVVDKREIGSRMPSFREAGGPDPDMNPAGPISRLDSSGLWTGGRIAGIALGRFPA